jgi:hypothetical protein
MQPTEFATELTCEVKGTLALTSLLTSCDKSSYPVAWRLVLFVRRCLEPLKDKFAALTEESRVLTWSPGG